MNENIESRWRFIGERVGEAMMGYKYNKPERFVITKNGELYWLDKETYDFKETGVVDINGLRIGIDELDQKVLKRNEDKTRGYGGREFRFKYPDGTIVKSTNCWYNDWISDKELALIPDEIKTEVLICK